MTTGDSAGGVASTTTGEQRLATLLGGLRPSLQDGEYVYCTVAHHLDIAPEDMLFTFAEVEGRTLVVPKGVAEQHGLAHTFPCEWIIIQVHSSLEAVGMMAAIATALADAGISCNVVSAYFHDHLFVPLGQGANAVLALEALASKAEDTE